VRNQVQTRLEALKKEFETGQIELEKVEKQRTYLREMMLRISGAIRILEELLAKDQAAGHDGPYPEAAQPTVAQVDQPAGSRT